MSIHLTTEQHGTLTALAARYVSDSLSGDLSFVEEPDKILRAIDEHSPVVSLLRSLHAGKLNRGGLTRTGLQLLLDFETPTDRAAGWIANQSAIDAIKGALAATRDPMESYRDGTAAEQARSRATDIGRGEACGDLLSRRRGEGMTLVLLDGGADTEAMQRGRKAAALHIADAYRAALTLLDPADDEERRWFWERLVDARAIAGLPPVAPVPA